MIITNLPSKTSNKPVKICLSDNRPRLINQFIRFGLVGLSGMAVGLGVLNLSMVIYENFILANLVAFLAAVTWNFFLNRRFTFQSREITIFRQWCRFVLACLTGAAANWAVSMTLYYSVGYFRSHFNQAALIGVATGFIANFFLSKRFVFQACAKPVVETTPNCPERN